MAIGCSIILIGASVITAAQNRAMFLGGRFVLGFGIAISTTAAPTWVTELAPAHWRGRLGAAYNSAYRPPAALYSLHSSSLPALARWPPTVERGANVTGLSARLMLGFDRLLLHWRDPGHWHHGRNADVEQHLGVATPSPPTGASASTFTTLRSADARCGRSALVSAPHARSRHGHARRSSRPSSSSPSSGSAPSPPAGSSRAAASKTRGRS